MTSWGFKGKGLRSLEMPRGSAVEVSPEGRARIRYNETLGRLEQSINTGPWEPLSVGSGEPVSQTAWYVDAISGDDQNDGETPATAIATFRELMGRWSGQSLDQDTTVTIENDTDEDIVLYGFSIGENGSLHVLGPTTVLYSGSFTAVTDQDPATNQPAEITDAALPSGWVLDGLIGKRLRVTSGAAAGAISWVARDLGGNVARVSPWVIPPALPSLIPWVELIEPVNVSPGDNYVVEDLIQVKSISLSGILTAQDHTYPEAPIRVLADSLEVLSPSDTQGYIGGYGQSTAFRACKIRNLGATYGSTALYGVYLRSYTGGVGAGSSVDGTGLLIDGQALFSPESSWQIFNSLFSDCVSTFVAPGTVLFLNDVGLMDSGQDGITVFSDGSLNVSNTLWGSGHTGHGIRLYSGGKSFHRTGDLTSATITGALGDWNVGGTDRSHAEVPYTNVSNLSEVVEF